VRDVDGLGVVFLLVEYLLPHLLVIVRTQPRPVQEIGVLLQQRRDKGLLLQDGLLHAVLFGVDIEFIQVSLDLGHVVAKVLQSVILDADVGRGLSEGALVEQVLILLEAKPQFLQAVVFLVVGHVLLGHFLELELQNVLETKVPSVDQTHRGTLLLGGGLGTRLG